MNDSNWIARDMDGAVFVYRDKPIRMSIAFAPAMGDNTCRRIKLPLDMNKKLTWDNSPKRIKITYEIIESNNQ